MHDDLIFKRQQEHRQARHICTNTSLTAKGPTILNLEKRKFIGFWFQRKLFLKGFAIF